MSGKGCNMLQSEPACAALQRWHCKELTVLGCGIRINLYDTGAGMNILIEGGEKGHIGAVAAAESGTLTDSIVFPSHKEGVVCERWAREVSSVVCGPVVVEAGIHYDNITKEQIQEVLEALELELAGLLKRMSTAKE